MGEHAKNKMVQAFRIAVFKTSQFRESLDDLRFQHCFGLRALLKAWENNQKPL